MRHLMTIGELAARLGQPVHRIRYVIATREVRPIAKAGGAFVFADWTLEQLRQEIAAIERRRTDGGTGHDPE